MAESTQKTRYAFLIHNPFQDRFAGNSASAKAFAFDKLLEDYIESALNNSKSRELVNFLEHIPFRIYNSKNQLPVFEHNGDHFNPYCTLYRFAREDNIDLEITECERLNLNEWDACAVRNLTSIVKDTDLSLGDKKLIKDIAITSWRNMLSKALTPGGYAGLGVTNCLVRTDLHEGAMHELESYGFEIDNPTFKNIDLSIE